MARRLCCILFFNVTLSSGLRDNIRGQGVEALLRAAFIGSMPSAWRHERNASPSLSLALFDYKLPCRRTCRSWLVLREAVKLLYLGHGRGSALYSVSLA